MSLMNTPETPADNEPGREAYYAEARSWAEDRDAARARTLRMAWIVAGIAGGIAVLEGLALIALAPLKTVVPYTLLVDRNTGFVEALEGTGTPQIKPQAALTASLLAQYVAARETFDINSLPEQYRKVALWSADDARAGYLAMMPAGNPDSPLARYPRSTVLSTRVESVSPMGPGIALVRFVTERVDQGQGAPQRLYWVASITYRFSGEPMAIEDRLVNPLGFQVLHYRRDAETAPFPEGTALSTNIPAVSTPQPIVMPVPVAIQPVPVAVQPAAVQPTQARPVYGPFHGPAGEGQPR